MQRLLPNSWVCNRACPPRKLSSPGTIHASGALVRAAAQRPGGVHADSTPSIRANPHGLPRPVLFVDVDAYVRWRSASARGASGPWPPAKAHSSQPVRVNRRRSTGVLAWRLTQRRRSPLRAAPARRRQRRRTPRSDALGRTAHQTRRFPRRLAVPPRLSRSSGLFFGRIASPLASDDPIVSGRRSRRGCHVLDIHLNCSSRKRSTTRSRPGRHSAFGYIDTTFLAFRKMSSLVSTRPIPETPYTSFAPSCALLMAGSASSGLARPTTHFPQMRTSPQRPLVPRTFSRTTSLPGGRPCSRRARATPV